MPAVEGINVCATTAPQVALATQYKGTRTTNAGQSVITCQLTLQPPAKGQWPQVGTAYVLRFRDQGANTDQVLNLTCIAAPAAPVTTDRDGRSTGAFTFQ